MNTEPKKIREFGAFRLDTEQKILWHEGTAVSMPLKELEVLCLLVENQGKLVGKTEILDKIWADSFAGENNLSRHIYLLRKTLRERGADKNLIENVPRRGYRFTGEAREIPSGEIIVEKHTRTQTLIEFQEEGAEEEEKGRKGERETKTTFLKLSFSTLLLFSFSFLFAGGAFFGYQNWRAGASTSEIKSIAVLPFKVIDAGGGENSHHGLGLTDVLITRLSSIREIKVRPTAAVSNLETEDALVAGQKLKTDAVLEGAIYRAGEKVRVTARLVRTADGAIIWNGQIEKLKTDELLLQNEIALQVTDALRLNLSGDEKNALTKRFTENADAFELYQKGRFEWNKRSRQAMVDAEHLFRGAIAKDPNFALAYVGLADTIAMKSEPTEADAAVQKAIELDPKLAEAYASRGFYQMFHQWNWQKAEDSFRKSIELNPNYATAHHWYAQVLTVQGRHEEAKAAMLRALEINPLSYNFLADLGQIYYFNREYGKAEEYCLRALEIYPDFIFAHEYLHDIYLKTGAYEKAVEMEIRADEINMTFANQSGERKRNLEARIEQQRKDFREGGIKSFVENSIRNFSEPTFIYLDATKYAFLGEKEKALDFLEKAVEGRAFLSAFIKADPVFDDLRDEPRYQAILKKMNLF